MNKIVRQVNLVPMQEAFNHVVYRRRRIGSGHLELTANAGKRCSNQRLLQGDPCGRGKAYFDVKF